MFSNHASFHFTEPRSDWNFRVNPHLIPRVPFHSIYQTPARLDRRNGFRLELPNQKPHYIARLGSISEFPQETFMARPEHIPSYRPRKLPSCLLIHTHFSNYIPTHPLPHTHPTTHLNLPPSLFPLAPPLLHLTHGLYQAAVGGHTGHTVLVFKAGSHSQVQSQM